MLIKLLQLRSLNAFEALESLVHFLSFVQNTTEIKIKIEFKFNLKSKV